MANWIPANINIDFVGRRRKFWALSITLVVLSIAVLIVNSFLPGRGSPLNYGIDFKGGTQIQVDFAKDVPVANIRKALTQAGYSGAEVVSMQDPKRPHLILLRLSEFSSFSTKDVAKARKDLAAAFPKQIKSINHKSGADRFYVQFTEAVKIDAGTKGAKTGAKVIKTLTAGGLDAKQATLYGRPEDRTYEVRLGSLADDVGKAFAASLGKDAVKDIPQVESVGPKMGKQLRNDGIKSVLYALLLMLVYIALRFDFRYAPGAVVALAHDVIITIGIFAATWVEFSLPVIAALLTISGYSINDTIVVFDRIRENVARLRDRKFPLVVNASINETLSRTLLTSVTTLFTCVAIWVLGTGVLRTFAMALTIGVLVGTYSSVFIASPLVIALNERVAQAKRRVRTA